MSKINLLIIQITINTKFIRYKPETYSRFFAGLYKMIYRRFLELQNEFKSNKILIMWFFFRSHKALKGEKGKNWWSRCFSIMQILEKRCISHTRSRNQQNLPLPSKGLIMLKNLASFQRNTLHYVYPLRFKHWLYQRST